MSHLNTRKNTDLLLLYKASKKQELRRRIFKALVIMKLTGILLILCLQVSATGVAQTISLSRKEVSLKEVFTEINRQTGYEFVFDAEILSRSNKISIDVKDAPLENVLALCFKDQPLTYVIIENTIVVKKINAQSTSLTTDKHFVKVEGTVVDTENNPLPGVNVIVKGTTTGASTNNAGKYTIEVETGNVLVFSFIGFKTFEITIGNQSVVDVSMQEDIKSLESVQITGTSYWSVAKEKSTSSIVKVTAKEIERQPVTSPLMALQGRVAGLEITPQNGTPGSAPTIRIRGNGSLRAKDLSGNISQAGSYPLFVIDGVPVESTQLTTSNPSMRNGMDPLSTLSPANIESIEVLKDGDATAIYGSRGANGVIVIKTKKNEGDENTHVTVGFYSGVGEVSNKLDLLTRKEYLLMRREAYSNDNLPIPTIPMAGSGADLTVWDTTRTTDWQEELLGGTANINDFQGTFSGGNKNTSFQVGGSYHTETLVFPGDFKYKRATGQMNLDHKSSNQKFRFNIALNYGKENHVSPANLGFISQALTLPAIAPALYDQNGNLNWQPDPNGTDTWDNPLANILQTGTADNSNLLSSMNMSYELIPGLALKSRFGFTELNSEEIIIFPIASNAPGTTTTGMSDFNYNKRNSWIFEPQVQYEKRLGVHEVQSLIGLTFQEQNSSFQYIRATGYTSDAGLGILSKATDFTVRDVIAQYKYTAFFFRVAYNYKGRYLVNLTGRRDGSSRFGPSNQFGNFGALGVAWVFSDESFMEKLPFLTFGKLRGSYAVTGNDQIGDYVFYNLYQQATANYQTGTSLTPRSLFNPDFQWEVTKKLEAAVELGLFENKISLEVNYFLNKSSNQLIDYQLPATAGFPSVASNFDATIRNTGWEWMVSTVNLDRSGFKWTTGLNLSFPKNELVAFDGIENSSYATVYKVGEPLFVRYLLTFTGVDPQTGKYTFLDRNNDGLINTSDRSLMKPLVTKYYGGISNAVSFKGFEFSFLFQFSSRYTTKLDIGTPGSPANNQHSQVLQRWQQEGDQTTVAGFSTSTVATADYINLMRSDFNYELVSFLRLKTISLSYTFPGEISSKARLKMAQIYVQGQNIFTVTDYVNLDPETGSTLPPLRMVTVGLQLKL